MANKNCGEPTADITGNDVINFSGRELFDHPTSNTSRTNRIQSKLEPMLESETEPLEGLEPQSGPTRLRVEEILLIRDVKPGCALTFHSSFQIVHHPLSCSTFFYFNAAQIFLLKRSNSQMFTTKERHKYLIFRGFTYVCK